MLVGSSLCAMKDTSNTTQPKSINTTQTESISMLITKDENKNRLSVFVSSKFDKGARKLSRKKSIQQLTREDYVSFLRHSHPELLDERNWDIRFFGCFRGSSFEILSKKYEVKSI